MITLDTPIMRRATLVAGPLLIAVVLLVFLLPNRSSESPMHSTGATYGRILVDSPEVYTRERMVNDRFRQEAWLLGRLTKLEETSVQGVVERQKMTTRSANVSVTQSIKTPPTDGEPVSDEPNTAAAIDAAQSEANTASTGQPKLTPIEAFRDHQSFREEVRNAIMENQLDDRHDLGGNTLYRLKFDATIIPGSDTSAWAQIMVKFRRKSGEPEEELRELYKRWMSDLREQVNAIYSEELIKAAGDKEMIYEAGWREVGMSVGEHFFGDTADDLDEYETLGEMKCRRLLLLQDGQEENQVGESEASLRVQKYSSERYECLLEALPIMEICERSACEDQLIRKDVLVQVLDALGTTIGETADLKKKLASHARTGKRAANDSPVVSDRTDSQKFVTFVPGQEGNSILVEEYTTNTFALPLELIDSERRMSAQKRVFLVPVALIDLERETYVAFSGQETDENILNNWSDWTLGTCDEVVQISVAGRMFRVCDSSLKELASHEEGSTQLDAKIESDKDGQPFVSEKWSDEKILNYWSSWMSCEEPAQIRVAGRLFHVCDSSLQELASHTDAPIVIDAVIEYSPDDDSPPIVVAKVGFHNFRTKLRNSDDEKFLFSYAITPRESSQQLASSSRLAAAEQFRVNASGALGGAGLDVSAGRSSLFSEFARIMERRPIVVGIATHAPSDGQSADFGWLIGPKLVVGSNGLTTYRQLPSQNSLAAIVSAPSWWRRADITIETGWLDDEGELIGAPVIVDYPIALPGDQEEITSALLLGGKRPAPSVENVEPTLLKVGEKAKLLIEGQNLWRSTVVTIGAQRSKRIFVLPNMKGIIAEFDAIEIQATRPTDDDSIAAVRVWTSEGVAKWKDGIKIEYSP